MGDASISSLNERVEDYELLKKDGLLSDDEVSMIVSYLGDSARKFVLENLSPEDRGVIENGRVRSLDEMRRDEIILAMIAKMIREEPERRAKFDCYTPKKEYAAHCIDLQKQWIETERGLLGGTNDTGVLIRDMNKYCNAERFRAFYTIKYPSRSQQRCMSGTGQTCGRRNCLMRIISSSEDTKRAG